MAYPEPGEPRYNNNPSMAADRLENDISRLVSLPEQLDEHLDELEERVEEIKQLRDKLNSEMRDIEADQNRFGNFIDELTEELQISSYRELMDYVQTAARGRLDEREQEQLEELIKDAEEEFRDLQAVNKIVNEEEVDLRDLERRAEKVKKAVSFAKSVDETAMIDLENVLGIVKEGKYPVATDKSDL